MKTSANRCVRSAGFEPAAPPPSRRRWLLLLLLFVACATTPPPYAEVPRGKATVRVVDITPQPGTRVGATTVIDATLEYAIEGFDARAEYYIGVLFAQQGTDVTYNETEGFRDMPRLRTASGTVRVRYPIAKEFASGRLTSPIEIMFNLMQRTGPHKTFVIGNTGRLQYLR